MRLFKLNLLTLILANIISTSCQKSAQSDPTDIGGSVVGNGFTKFQHPKYNFSFEFDSSLSITTPSNDLVIVDNSNLLKAADAQVSRARFTVLDFDDSATDSLLQLAQKQVPNIEWQSEKSFGVESVFSLEKQESSAQGNYFFRLNDKKVLHVLLVASSVGGGLDLILPIVNKISFDTSSPVIHKLIFEPQTIQAGDIARLKIFVTDNSSHLSSKNLNEHVGLTINQKCHKLRRRDQFGVEACGELKHLGQGWYEMNIQTSQSMPAGEYVLDPLMFWDDSGNPSRISPDYDVADPLFDTAEKLPSHYLRVENNSPDKSGPIISNIRFEPAAIHAGQRTSLIFDAEDTDPNFRPQYFCDYLRHTNFNAFPRVDISRTPEIEPTEYFIPICGNPERRPDGSWSLSFSSLDHLPPGNYGQWIKLSDKSTNQRDFIYLELQVKNDAEIDASGPEINAIKADRSQLKQDETGTLLFEATDKLSGIGPTLKIDSKDCYMNLTMVNAAKDDTNDKWRIPLCDSKIRHINDNWYAIDFHLGKNIPTGNYLLKTFSVSDTIGNRTYLKSSEENHQGTYINIGTNQKSGIPVVTFTVNPK